MDKKMLRVGYTHGPQHDAWSRVQRKPPHNSGLNEAGGTFLAIWSVNEAGGGPKRCGSCVDIAHASGPVKLAVGGRGWQPGRALMEGTEGGACHGPRGAHVCRPPSHRLVSVRRCPRRSCEPGTLAACVEAPRARRLWRTASVLLHAQPHEADEGPKNVALGRIKLRAAHSSTQGCSGRGTQPPRR